MAGERHGSTWHNLANAGGLQSCLCREEERMQLIVVVIGRETRREKEGVNQTKHVQSRKPGWRVAATRCVWVCEQKQSSRGVVR